MNLFITGFGPFLDHKDNPSALLAVNSGFDHAVLAVSYRAVNDFFAGWAGTGYDGLLMIGLAAKRSRMSLESKGWNRKGGTRDAAGAVAAGKIEEDGPECRLASLWSGIALDDHRLEFSEDAGDYLCNYVLYRALGFYPELAVGFLHVPPVEIISLEEQGRMLSNLTLQLNRLHPPQPL